MSQKMYFLSMLSQETSAPRSFGKTKQLRKKEKGRCERHITGDSRQKK
jgi:hypothetical protein